MSNTTDTGSMSHHVTCLPYNMADMGGGVGDVVGETAAHTRQQYNFYNGVLMGKNAIKNNNPQFHKVVAKN